MMLTIGASARLMQSPMGGGDLYDDDDGDDGRIGDDDIE